MASSSENNSGIEQHVGDLYETFSESTSRCCESELSKVHNELKEIEYQAKHDAEMEYESQQKFSQNPAWRNLGENHKDKKREKKIRSAVVSRAGKKKYTQYLERHVAEKERRNSFLLSELNKIRKRNKILEGEINRISEEESGNGLRPSHSQYLQQRERGAIMGLRDPNVLGRSVNSSYAGRGIGDSCELYGNDNTQDERLKKMHLVDLELVLDLEILEPNVEPGTFERQRPTPAA